MRRLRWFAVACGTILLGVAAFGAVEYGAESGVEPFVTVALLGVSVAVSPGAIERGKHVLYQFRRQTKGANTRTGGKDQYYVAPAGDDRERLLERIRETLTENATFDRVRMERFPEGNGLSVRHGGFHGSFVRINRRGRIVVAGASERTADLADAVADAIGVSFERSWANPMRRRRPLQGGPRVFLAGLLLVATVGGTVGVAAAGYPSSAYNPIEKTVFASHDARAVLNPGTSETEAAIAKARFRVTALEEADVEVAWAQNNSRRIATYGLAAVAIAADARRAVRTLRSHDLTREQVTRVDAIAADLRAAEVDVADALERRTDDAGVEEHGESAIHTVAGALRSHDPGTPGFELDVDLPEPEGYTGPRTVDGNASA